MRVQGLHRNEQYTYMNKLNNYDMIKFHSLIKHMSCIFLRPELSGEVDRQLRRRMTIAQPLLWRFPCPRFQKSLRTTPFTIVSFKT